VSHAGAATAERAPHEAEQFNFEARRYYDTVTWLAEVLPGVMRTPFEFSFDGTELYASDGSRMGKVFDDSIDRAATLPKHLCFEQRRTQIEKGEYLDMLAMMQGTGANTIVVTSDFPPELMETTEDVGGYNVSRKPTMMRVLTKTPKGTLKMYSQSLDGSNREALEAIHESLGFKAEPGELLGQRRYLDMGEHEQEFLIDHLTGVYDRSLQAQHGGEWRAGRQNDSRINTYDFVRQQTDLLAVYFATTDGFTGGRADYNLAAAMKKRYAEDYTQPDWQEAPSTHDIPVVAYALAATEMGGAGREARRKGEVMSGCGGTVDGESNDDSAESQLEKAGYGGKLDTGLIGDASKAEKLVWKDGVCIIDNCPTRPGKTKVAQCSICKLCQGWFDKGKDPSNIYKPEIASFWSIIEANFSEKEEEDD
jgi:hypothetical protein